MRYYFEAMQQQHHALPPGEGVLNKVLYREALPGGKIPYPAMKYHSDRKGTPYLLLTKYGTPLHTYSLEPCMIPFYYIDTDEIPRFFLLLKNHIFISRSEDTIFIFHV